MHTRMMVMAIKITMMMVVMVVMMMELLIKIRGKVKNPILSFLNINSLRNKSDNLFDLLGNLIDILIIAETKLDYSFTNALLHRENFKIPF